MRLGLGWISTSIIVATVYPARAEQLHVPSAADATPAPGSLWPSEKLSEYLLTRWADGLLVNYALTDEQRSEVHRAVVARWRPFLRRHREKIEPLVQEFLELRLAPTPPTEEQLGLWSERAIPVLQRVREELLTGLDDFRRPMTPLQRARFELHALGISTGTQLALQQLELWRQGDFRVEDVWQPPPRAKPTPMTAEHKEANESDQGQRDEGAKRQRDEGAHLHAAGTDVSSARGILPPSPTPPDQIALEMDAWQAYVADFIRRHELDEGQRSAALSCLGELRDRALAHRDLHREKLDQLEAHIQRGAADEQEAKELKRMLVELYGPVDAMFQELVNRLEQLPTAAQKASATTGRKDLRKDPQPKQK